MQSPSGDESNFHENRLRRDGRETGCGGNGGPSTENRAPDGSEEAAREEPGRRSGQRTAERYHSRRERAGRPKEEVMVGETDHHSPQRRSAASRGNKRYCRSALRSERRAMQNLLMVGTLTLLIAS